MGAQMTQREASIDQITKLGVRVLEAIPTIGLTSDGAQAHIERGVFTEAVKLILKANPDAVDIDKLREMLSSYLPFGDEEYADSEFGYPIGFPKKTWQQRLGILRNNFGGPFTRGWTTLLLCCKVVVWMIGSTTQLTRTSYRTGEQLPSPIPKPQSLLGQS